MFSFALLSLFLTGCVEDVGKDKVKAEVQEAKPVEAPAPAPKSMEAAVLDVQKAGSSIRALGAKVTAEHPIDFKDFTGKLTTDGKTITKVDFTIDMTTLESDDPRLTEHLKNEDFFDVPNHPKSMFVSTKITPKEGKMVEVEGNMTIRGTTKSITFPATVEMKDGKAMARAEFVLNRQDFKVTYPGRKDDLIQDNVAMTISLTAAKGAAGH